MRERLREDYRWTERQRQVLDLMARGKTNTEIAAALGVSLAGAKWHVSEILSKLNSDSREEAAEYWRRYNGLAPRFARVFRGFVAGGVGKAVTGGAIAVVAVGVAGVLLLASGDDDELVSPGTPEPTPAAAATSIASRDSDLVIVGDDLPYLVKSDGLKGCAGREVEVSWLFQVVTPGEGVEERLFDLTHVLVDADGRLEAELAPLTEFPGTWKGHVAITADCLGFGGRKLEENIRIGVFVDSPVAQDLGLILPSDVVAEIRAVLIYPGEWLSPDFVLADESYASPQEKLLTNLAIIVDGQTCFPRGTFPQITSDGSILFVLGGVEQAPECGREAAAATFLMGQGPSQVESLSGAEVRRGVIQPIVLIPPPPAGLPPPTPLPALDNGVWPEGTQTGIAIVDKVIQLVESKDAAGLAQLVEFSTYPCEAQGTVQAQSLVCRDGMSPGDPISGVWATHVEGGLWSADRAELEERFIEVLRENFRLHAVWEYQAGESVLDWLPGVRYSVIFTYQDPQAGVAFTSFNVTDTGLLWIAFQFPTPPTEAWDDPSAPGWILPRAE